MLEYIYASVVIKGLYDYNKLPANIKDKVDEVLKEKGREDLIKK